MAGWQSPGATRHAVKESRTADPAVAVWRKWRAASRQTELLWHHQQRLEWELTETVGFPFAPVQLLDDECMTLHSAAAPREALDPSPEEAAVRAKVEADLAAHLACWDAADKKTGYSATLQSEREAADRAEGLLELLSKTPAASLAGVVAKLDTVVREGQPSKDEPEFPWPQIRSARDDLIRLAKELVPEQVFPNEIRQQHRGRPGEVVCLCARR